MAVLHCTALAQVNYAVLFMKTSFHSIKLKQSNLGGCNICNSLHERNGKYENLNSIKSQLHYHHATYYSCSCVVNFIHGNRFALVYLTTSSKFETRKLHTIISQLHHITTAKHFVATATF